MKFIPPNLKDNPYEIHSYFKSSRKLKFANQFHWKAIKYAASKIESTRGKVAEIGCGEGYFIPTLSYYFNSVLAIDNSSKMLESARKYFKYKNVNYVKDNIASPKYPEIIQEKYDWVICLETLEHMSQWDIALDNMFEMLVPGGRILLSVPVEVGFPLFIKEVGRYISYGKGSGWKLNCFIKKVIGSRNIISRENYGSHMGFDYRDVIDYIRKMSYININHTSFFPVNSKYFGLRVYIIAQKAK